MYINPLREWNGQIIHIYVMYYLAIVKNYELAVYF